MTRETLKAALLEAIQREHGYSQPGIAETVLKAIHEHQCGVGRKVRLYVAGRMTGLPELNFPAFHAEAVRLRALGYEVVNPAEINEDPSAGWAECMRRDIAQLVFCDGVVTLPGWELSRGASLEVSIARELSIRVLTPSEVTQ